MDVYTGVLIRKFHREAQNNDDQACKTTEAEISVFISVMAHGNPPPVASVFILVLIFIYFYIILINVILLQN